MLNQTYLDPGEVGKHDFSLEQLYKKLPASIILFFFAAAAVSDNRTPLTELY